MKTDTTNDLVERIFKVARLMKDEMSYTHDVTHLSILQIQTLFFLKHDKDKNISMSDIAAYFRIELPSATSLVNKLCDQKLVERRADQNDRRLVLITLTADGKTMLEDAMCARRKKLEKILSYLSEKEKSDLSSIFKTLYNKLQVK
ncbi:MAG TPA: MarR family winged helix-turn-helix transcriptional regulator [Patescibacteria group bacterium]|jgi:DNA-binding MarR family transcriptional regulator|nr:MarR family winged helix-turn-helix transcriptional regulator [Patescibacteria group bacterium]